MIRSVGLAPKNCAGTSINERLETTYYRNYLVEADLDDDEYFIRTNLGIALFTGHPADPFARCKGIGVDHVDRLASDDGTARRMLWSARVEWGTINPFDAAESGNPEDCQLQVVIEGVDFQAVADFDKDGNPVVNSAGDPFNPPVMRDGQRIQLKITEFRKDLTVEQIFAYANRTNRGPFQGKDPGYWKIGIPIVEPRYSQFLDVIFYRVQWTVAHNPDGWKATPLDAGFRSADKTSTPYKLVTLLDDKTLMPCSEPRLLDGTGKALPLPADADSIVAIEFDIYQDADFDALHWPENILVTTPTR